MTEFGNWCLIENPIKQSDPGVFTLLVKQFGVEGVQFEELWSLDKDSLEPLKPVHALIFLFKWTSAHDKDLDTKIIRDDQQLKKIFFMNQMIPNACATQAIVSSLMNIKHPDVQIGPQLADFQQFTSDMDSQMRGLTLTNSEQIRTAHNSFAKHVLFEQESRRITDDDDVFHFVAYLPVDGHVYELDGLQPGPVDHGQYSDDDWLPRAAEIIQQRMQQYSSDEIRFNLMALVSDKRPLLEKRVAELEEKSKTAPKEQSDAIRAQLNDEKGRLFVERQKFAAYEKEYTRRQHNYLPFMMELIKILAEEKKLKDLTEKAKELTERSTKRLAELKKNRA